jgi:hypothetical protein
MNKVLHKYHFKKTEFFNCVFILNFNILLIKMSDSEIESEQ